MERSAIAMNLSFHWRCEAIPSSLAHKLGGWIGERFCNHRSRYMWTTKPFGQRTKHKPRRLNSLLPDFEPFTSSASIEDTEEHFFE
ncbi:hypothetical protein CA13_54760 [Planctomycetes bacterium CA13]|uniref:Uncharacterized protein n=1 Tax=Novipirellula herctigrandis TaxID=2527986 RepID=A0A5C5Z9J9_9BACT|nr:hypothetical protein CA13_54760 [Planctomycetes bacterium CA13]